jgi:hypothetical protein
MTRLQQISKHSIQLALALGAAGAALAAQASTASNVDVNVVIGGVIQPGVYGRVEVGTRPPPVLYPQPVTITPPVIVRQPVIVQPQIVVQQAPVVVTQSPIYLHVPPGDSKHWSRHCREYNACNQPVYFVRNDYRAYYDGERSRSEGHGHGHGKH